MREKGEHLGIYHVGTMEEVTIADLARRVAGAAGREIELVRGEAAAGGTPRRCPDISKLARLGYKPRVPLERRPQADARLVLAQRRPGAQSLTASTTRRPRFASQQSRARLRHRRQRPGRVLSGMRPRPAR